MTAQAPRHVAIIGAGIVGVCAALHLQRRGCLVTLFDPLGAGEAASKGNAAVIAADSCVPVATPGILWDVPGMLLDPLGPLAIRWTYLPRLAPWLWRFLRASAPDRVEAISIALAAVLAQSVEAWLELLREVGAADMLHRRGWLGVWESDRRWRGAQAAIALQRRRGVAMDVLGPDEIRQLEPALAPIYRHAVLYPGNAHVVDNYRLVRVLAGHVVANGGELRLERVAGLEFDGAANGQGSPSHLRTVAGRYPIDAAVIAAGAWSRPFALALGHPVPLDTERGYHVTLPDPGMMPRLPIYSGDHSFAVTPLEHGLRLAGTVELGGLRTPPNFARADMLLRHGRRMFANLNEAGRSDWMGFRPSLPDSLPVISASPRHRNVFFAFGHGHLGLTLGAVTGRLVADLVTGREPGVDLAPFRVDRF